MQYLKKKRQDFSRGLCLLPTVSSAPEPLWVMDILPAAAEGTQSLCALEGGRFSLDLCPFFTFQILEEGRPR